MVENLLSSGDFSFVLSGCSREELNGEYVQQEKFYGHRPVFYCAENKRVLYYHKANRAWQMLARTKCLFFLIVTRHPYRKGEVRHGHLGLLNQFVQAF